MNTTGTQDGENFNTSRTNDGEIFNLPEPSAPNPGEDDVFIPVSNEILDTVQPGYPSANGDYDNCHDLPDQQGGEAGHQGPVEDAEPYREENETWDNVIQCQETAAKEPSQNITKDTTCRFWTGWNYFVTFALLGTLVWGIIAQCSGALPIGLFVFCGLLLIYWIENACSSTSQYLGNFVSLDDSETFLERMQQTCPSISFHIQCYHIEHYTTTSRDSDGNTRTEHHTRRVDTWWARKSYDFDCWQDLSNIQLLNEQHVTKYKLEKVFTFADAYTQSHFQMSKMHFIRMNDRDDHYDFHTSFDIPGFMNRMLVETQPGSANKYFSSEWFCCSVAFFWSACYRSWFMNNCGKERIVINKCVQKQERYVLVPMI